MAIQTPIRGLRSFCVAAKCLSFKHAAQQLYLTPSAVSHQIKQLEQQLGIELFLRQTRSIELTRAGQEFYASVMPLIKALETTIADFTGNRQNKKLAVSMPEFFASELFVPRLSEWAELNPDINLQLETLKYNEEASKSSDLSIVLSDHKPHTNIVYDLFPIRYIPACSQKIYEKHVATGLSALKSVPLILHQAKPWAWHQWAEQHKIIDFNPKQIIQFESMFGVVRAAQQGMGIALVPLPMSNEWFTQQLIIKLFDQELQTNDRYYLIQHENAATDPTSDILADWVKERFKNL